jgi:XTP/dITP diphosphohydrolase
VTRLLLATNNAHKVEEYAKLLDTIPVASLRDYPQLPDVIEDRPDFVGNAIKKALETHAHTGAITIADDSGLEVAALGGEPGVYSARWVPGTDADRYRTVLARMANVTDRRARFVCVLAVAGLSPQGPLAEGLTRQEGCVIAHGVVHGVINHGPRGENGFGYDPIFELPDGRTIAELNADEKHSISHRGHAARALLPFLRTLFS